jgi:hypothetical protein
VATVTGVIELLVGLACLGMGAAIWSRKHVVGVILGTAGLAAVAHALIELL